MDEVKDDQEERKEAKSMGSYSKRRRYSIENKKCSCPSRSECTCVKRRLTITPGISEDEVMEKETKLIVLEFLSSLRSDSLTARNKTFEDSATDSLNRSAEDFKNNRKSEKAHTVTIGEQERKEILAYFKKQREEEDSKKYQRLNRSASEINDKKIIDKLIRMQVPVRKWMDENLRTEIVQFDKGKLNKSPAQMKSPLKYPVDRSPRKSKHKVARRSMSKKSLIVDAPIGERAPLQLSIPRKSMEQFIEAPEDIVTPETFAVNRLEEMSQEIMLDYPDLLNKPISELLGPLKSKSTISYDSFSKVAKSVFDTELARVNTTVWSRVALTLYMVKETMFSGSLNDTQLELMVDYSTRFFTDNAKQQVELEGGWDSLDDSLFAGTGFEIFSTSSDDEEDTPEKLQRRESRKISRQQRAAYQNCTLREQVSRTIYEWAPLGMAAMLVGLGIAFSYVKT